MMIKVKNGQIISLVASGVFILSYLGANYTAYVKKDSNKNSYLLEAESIPLGNSSNLGAMVSTTTSSSALSIGIVGLAN